VEDLYRENARYPAEPCDLQGHDADGPILAPDLLQGYNFGTCPHDYLAAEYQHRLASSSSAKKDGRHYVGGYLHYRLPASCWIINPNGTHFVDIMVDIDTIVGETRNRQSVVMIRNVTRIDAKDECLGLLRRITAHNTALRKAEAKGYARHKCEDVGTMHAIGTRIPLDMGGTPVPYAANRKVPDGVLRGLVADLATLGSSAPNVTSAENGCIRVGVLVRCLLPEFVLVAELNRGRGSGGVWKRPVVVGGPGPLTGRVSTGIPRKIGGATSGSTASTIATFRGESPLPLAHPLRRSGR
jgi:hypothetical protein